MPKPTDLTPETVTDPLEGQEVGMLNTMLARLYPLARDGDEQAVDRVIKILDLKRKYKSDRKAAGEDWRL